MAKTRSKTVPEVFTTHGAEPGAITRAITQGRLPAGPTATVMAEMLGGDDFQRLRQPGTYVTEVATDPQAFELLSVGLYREPASAMRELISNAYDADASTVRITTNPPHFDHISVEDDGSGMTLDALRQVIHHVGGSLKRRPEGERAGITGSKPGYSPRGRPLIGKLGIGLYSVRHMTNHFRIVTKEAGSDIRYIAEVRLRDAPPEDQAPEAYVAGTATIVAERVKNKEHYTRVELLDVTAEAKNTLRSYDRWDQFDATPDVHRRGQLRFHIARLSRDGETVRVPESLPWNRNHRTPLARFRAMVGRFSEKQEMVQTGPAVDLVLDYYFAMIWKIAHSAPLGYIAKSPFSLTAADKVDFYPLEGDATPEVLPPPPPGKTIADVTGIAELGTSRTPFSVFIDDLELRRPVLFDVDEHLYGPRQMIRKPKLFVGRYDSDQEKPRGWDAVDRDEDPDAKPLVFSAYFWWAPKIVPKENNGLLARIRNSSGTGFDHNFADYRTSELTRVRQISAEVFVEIGLDDALNIDRESFNQSHPHYRAMQRWVHRQLTRIMSRLKADQKRVRDDKAEHELLEDVEAVEHTARAIWSARRSDVGELVPSVVVTTKPASRRALADDTMLYIGGVRGPDGNVEKDERLSAKLRALTLVLDAYGLLDDLSPESRTQLLNDIAAVLSA